MHVNTFDRYQAEDSLIHSLDPRVKVIVTVLFILSNALLPDGAWLAFMLAWGLILLTSALSKLGLGYAIKRSFVALPFALARIGLEVGPLSQWLCAGLKEAGFAVELLETRHVRDAFRSMPVKTGRKDARGIAQLIPTAMN